MRGIAALVLALAVAAPAGGGDTPEEGASAAAPDTARGSDAVDLGPVDIRPIEAGERLPIDLPAALKLAGAENLDLLESKERIAEAEARAEEALGPLVPEAYGSVLTFGQRTSGQTLGLFTALGRSFDRVNAAGGAQVSTNPIQTMFAALAARRFVGAAESDAEDVGQRVLAEAAIRYFDLQESAAEVGIAEQALAASRELARIAESRERLGTGLSVDAEKAKARVAAGEVERARASDAFRKASIQLALVLRVDPKVTLVPLDREIRRRALVDPNRGLEDLIRQALEARPLLRAEAERVDAAKRSRAAAWAGSLAPSAYANFQENTVGGENRQFAAGAVGLRLSFTSLGAAHRASAEAERQRIDGERVRQQARADVIVAREDVMTAAEQIESARQGLRAATAAHQQSRARFEGGVGLALDVLDSQAELERARVNLVTAIVGHNTAQVRLLAALGGVSAEALLESRGGEDDSSTTQDPEGEKAMKTVRCGVVLGVLAAMSLGACGPSVPPAAVSWREAATVVAPGPVPGLIDVGYLRVETDTDQKANGDATYYNVRRPYEIYSTDGKLLRWVENQGARSGEEPESVPIPPGRYVIASVYGTVYRKVQVEVRRGALTLIGQQTLARSPEVFAK